MARPGNVGFLSQSGALCTAVLDWSLKENVGFSGFVSLGSMLDVGWGDLIYHLGDDPNTKSIVIYMETIGDARAFLSAAREVALTKPIIVIKPGRTERRRQGRRVAHRFADRQRRGVAGGVPARAACCAWTPFPNCSTWPKCWASSRAPRAAPDHRHQRRRPGRAGHGHADQQRRATGRTFPGNHGGLQQNSAATWSHNNPVDIIGDASAGTLRQGGGNRRRKIRTPTACWSF